MQSKVVIGGWRLAAHALLSLSVVWLVCSTAWAGTLQGTAMYRERIALPPDAVFEAELQDVSKADTPAVVLGRNTLDPAGQPPFRFEIAYDDAAVQAGHRYTVRATVKQQGRLLFMTDRHYPVLDGGNKPLQLLLVSARGGAKPKPAAGGIAPIEPRLTVTGTFRYMADAATITLCADGQRLPVAMEGEYKALEAAYRQSGTKPSQPLLASIEGRIAQRPSMEENQPPRATLVVERFINVWPRETCGTPLADSALRGSYWKLVRLGDSPVAAPAKQREAHLILANDTLRVAGSGGCNRLTGSFELEGDRLRFGRMAATMMACPDGMEQEKRFLNALEQVQGYRIRGSHLELLDANGEVAARLEAVALK